ncbi:MBL fold metallo-hydrolase [Inquilinus limosus]|uniref:MBL fold metallo-hydrolase n=1 Tax=Inquilinus limosus TaxID=171674 RepID=UPI0004129980|nr:MBL fold metallo-hydrolase [Inquilinus limosus]
MPASVPSRRAFLCGCAAGLSLALMRPVRAQDGETPPPLGFRELADGVWMHTSWKKLEQDWVPTNGLAVIGPEEALLIDTAWTPAQTVALLGRLAEVAPNRPVNLVVTHAHDDRLAGLAAVHARGGWSLARDETVKAAAAQGAGTIQRSWSGESTTITAAGRTVELFYPGPAHTRDNTVAFLPESAVLFGSCMIRAAERNTLGTIAESDLCRWPQSVEAVIARYGKAAKIAVPGGGEPGDAELLARTHQLAKAEAAKSCSPAG